MSMTDAINRPSASLHIDTVSASVPFDYANAFDSTDDHDIPPLTVLKDNFLLQTFNSTQSSNDFNCNGDGSAMTSNNETSDFDDILDDPQIMTELMSSEVKGSTQDDNVRQLHFLEANDALVPHMLNLSQEPSSSFTSLDEIEETPLVYPPQIHIRLQRVTSLNSLESCSPSKYSEEGEVSKQNSLKKCSSSTSIKSDTSETKGVKIWVRLKSKVISSNSRSLPVLNDITEENEIYSVSNSSESENIENKTLSKSDDLKKVFNSTSKWKKIKISIPSFFRQQNGHTQSPKKLEDGESCASNPVAYQSINTTQTHGVREKPSVEIDNKTIEHTSGRRRSSVNREDFTNQIARKYSDQDEDCATTIIKIAKRPSLKCEQYCTLVRKFITTLPPDQIATNQTIIKDATDVHPFRNGEAIVTDILSNKAVLFDTNGHPKVTFAMETGSEPWSTYVTKDGALAVTLKGAGSVSLWSPKGESLTEFGKDILMAPTGIQCDRLGRFVVTDEGTNTISLFSRNGTYLGMFGHGSDRFGGRLADDSDAMLSTSPEYTMTTNPIFKQPRYITVSRDGFYIISDSANQNVKILDQDGVLLQEIGSYGREDGQFRFPYGVAFDEETKLVYVADHFNNRVSVFRLNGSFLHHLLTQADGITRPKGLAITRSFLFVTYGDMRAGNISVYKIHGNVNRVT